MKIKCIVWDLDHTLWDGVLLENDNLAVRNQVEKIIFCASDKGIINSICSKNIFEEAKSKLQEFGLWDYFVYPQISFNDKSDLISNISRRLHILPRNILVIDDDVFERNEIKYHIPEINVESGADMNAIYLLISQYPTVSTSESKERLTLYRNEERRIRAEDSFSGSSREFLDFCNFQMVARRGLEEDAPRIAELIERAHQLSFNVGKYTKEEIINMVRNKLYSVFVISVKDRFGEYGLCGVSIISMQQPMLDAFVISCRLLGKGVSQEFMSFIKNKLQAWGYNTLICRFRRNQYNREMIVLLQMNSFSKCGGVSSTGIDVYKCTLEGTSKNSSWIKVVDLVDD